MSRSRWSASSIFACCLACSAQPEGHPTSHVTVTLPTTTMAPATEPTIAAPTAAPSATAPAAGGKLTGTWSSAACGDARKYAREITFHADGRFDATDLVSPCPPDARCVWSGLLNRSGTYATSGSTVKLTTGPASNKAGAPFPEDLAFEGGVVSENAASARCAYVRR